MEICEIKSWFGVQGLRFDVSFFGVLGSRCFGFGVRGLGFRVFLVFEVWGVEGLALRVEGIQAGKPSSIRVLGFGFRVRVSG